MSVEHRTTRRRESTSTSITLTAGIAWASTDHALDIVDHDGRLLVRVTLEHTSAGLKQMTRILTCAGVHEIAIGRGDGPVVEALLGAGFTVFVIAPGQVKNLRRRYGAAGNHMINRTTTSTPTSWPTPCAPTTACAH